jgi:hypothetical protein
MRWIPAGLLGLVLGALGVSHLAASPSPPPKVPAAGSPVPASLGDLNVWVSAQAHHAHWHHPGVRNLDPEVFGTVADPLGTEFLIGVPLYDRLDDGQGNWTTTALPVAESNVATHLPHGRASLRAIDRTPTDQATLTSPTLDQVAFHCEILDPWGRTLEIRASTPVPRGSVSPFFGGVGTNCLVHGQTGIGTKLMPRVFAYCIVYAKGEVLIDGQLLPGNDHRLVHVMVTHGTSDDTFAPGPAGGIGPFLGSNAEVDIEDLELHVSLPPIRLLPHPVPNSPVVGIGQEFIHLMFEDVELRGSSIDGVLVR